MDDKIREMVDRIQWFGHASFKLTGSKTIYIDPWKLPEGEGNDGDLVLVTHDHYDHCSPLDIKRALGSGGQLVVPQCCREKCPKADVYTLPFMNQRLQDISIYSTPAYNINKKFHLREYGHVGYIVKFDGIKIYHTGDSDAFPHMADLSCDIVMLPVSGTYVMDPYEAVDACNLLKPKVAIPMHWGDPDVVGTRENADTFAKLASCEVVIKDNPR